MIVMAHVIPRLVLGLALVAVMAGSATAARAGRSSASASAVPTFDVRPSCKTGVDAGIRKDIQACLDSENNSRAELVKHWDEFKPGDRTLCINAASTGGSATYTELITCLEMLRDAKALDQKEARDSASEPRTNGIGARTKAKR